MEHFKYMLQLLVISNIAFFVHNGSAYFYPPVTGQRQTLTIERSAPA